MCRILSPSRYIVVGIDLLPLFSIADMPTPRDRMVQVIRWYLCSFHAGRKSGVAKKPYNPVLGEVFRCHWSIPNVNSDDTTDSDVTSCKLISDGPVPWCKEDQLAFTAEQVSHHPPGIKEYFVPVLFFFCLFLVVIATLLILLLIVVVIVGMALVVFIVPFNCS